MSQNVSPADSQSSVKNGAAKTSDQSANKNAESGGSAAINQTAVVDPDENLCIDPETKREFNCDEEKNEEVRRIFREHAKKVKSVDKAKTEIKDKTNLIMSLFSSEAKEEVEKSKRKDPAASAAQEAQNEKDKQLLIKMFIGSFLLIFGLLFSTRFFSKG